MGNLGRWRAAQCAGLAGDGGLTILELGQCRLDARLAGPFIAKEEERCPGLFVVAHRQDDVMAAVARLVGLARCQG